MFESREKRLREERDAARQQAESCLMECDAANARVRELESRVKDTSQQLEVLNKELEVRPHI